MDSPVRAPWIEPVPESAVPGIVWPAIPSDRNAQAFAILAQLEMSQWWPPEILMRQQLRQATQLVSFAARTVPFYRERLAAFAGREEPLTREEWRSIPFLTKEELRDADERIVTTRPLDGHGNLQRVMTSGSTGAPISVQWNAIAGRFHAGITLRDHLWHRRDPAKKMAVVKRLRDGFETDTLSVQATRWFPGYRSGPTVFFDPREDIDAALDWFAREDPDYLMIYPTYLRSMILRSRETGFRPDRLAEVATVSEAVDDQLRVMCREEWGAEIVDMYSAQEAGFLALQCPDHDHYLVQSECSIVEVLDDRGQPCAPGETGRVIVTPLHNFTNPLIRYDLGDFAEVGEPCPSGRGLPVLRKIHGKGRNMVRLADGSQVWPALSGCGFEQIRAIRKVQMVQKTLRQISLRLVVTRKLTDAEEAETRASAIRALRHDFDVVFDYVDDLPRTAGGKFEDVVSEIDEESWRGESP